MAEVQKDHPKYFEMLQKHPYMLAGQQVPKLDGSEGMETLRDAEHAKQWQEAVKHLLVEEVRDRTMKAVDNDREFIDTIHSSIKLFQDNNDLIPGTKDFDKELADRFVAIAKPYEVREDGKLRGFGIPVQPLIEQLRTQLHAERAAKTAAGAPAAASTPAAPATGAPAAPAGGASTATSPAVDAPQAGITSKAGNSDQQEDFSTLFGTINPELRGMRI